jgi:hypothetical protein
LKKNNIKMNENGYFSIEFLYQVLLKFKTWIIINQQLIQYSHNTFFTYNLYDIFQANDLLIRHHSNTIFWKKNRSFLEFLIIIYITRIFLPRIFFLYKDNDVRKGATRYSINWLNMNLPKWQENSILNSDRVNISETTKQKILNIFKRKFLKKILSII